MKLLSFITILSITAISCNKKDAIDATPADKIKVAIKPVGIDEDNTTRSETDVMWVNIKK